MPVDHIRYDILAQEALRGVVRTVLADAAKNGLPGEHHFYISFDTRADGVRLSPRMLAEYPEEMTIVLQHQFWDLVVTEDGFEVGMSFGGIPERVAVPFAAINAFLDPSVEFGLRFQEIGDSAGEGQEDRGDARPPAEHKAGRPAATLAAVPAAASSEPAGAKSADKPTPEEGPEKPGGGEVVRLDRFRKK
jgi:uncharacterized protein